MLLSRQITYGSWHARVEGQTQMEVMGNDNRKEAVSKTVQAQLSVLRCSTSKKKNSS